MESKLLSLARSFNKRIANSMKKWNTQVAMKKAARDQVVQEGCDILNSLV